MSGTYRRRIATIAASLALLVAAVAANAAPAVKTKGSLEFTPDNALAAEAYQFGTVELPFKVRNTGSKPVRILEITPRRGSGQGTAEPNVLAPGETGRVLLRRQIVDLGVRHYGFRVRTDEAIDPNYSLRAYIFGQSAYTPDVPVIVVDNARFGHVSPVRITVSSYEADVLDLKAILEKPDWVDIAAVPRVSGESTQELVLEARIRANTPRGLNKGSVHLLTTVANQPDLVIPVVARVFDTVSATPIPATMKPAHVGDVREVEVVYRALDGKALTLEKVEESTGALKLKTSSCGSQCVKVVATYLTTAPGEVGGKITARFEGRVDRLEIGWDVLVLPKGAVIRDLGVIGDEPANIDGDASPTGAES